MNVTLKERIAILETELRGLKKILWALVTVNLAQIGVQII